MIDNQLHKSRKMAYISLGCKLNFSEMSSMVKMLQDAGYSKIKPGEIPDVCIVNTCTVTETADKKSRQAIHRLARQYPEAVVVVTGCFAQLKADDIAAIPGVDLVLGSNEKFNLVDYLEDVRKNESAGIHVGARKDIQTFLPSCSKGDRTRYFLKVQDGCDYFCSYCTIPFARGKSRNPDIDLLVSQARQVAAEGGKEIILTGVNIGDFGKSNGQNFLQLIKALDEVEGIERYRISSIEPNLLTEEVIAFTANSRRFAPHFHLPLQAGSDRMLRLMNRRYDTALFKSRVESIHRLLPTAFIGVDVIVGSRGETPEFFEEAVAIIESLDIAQLHVFSYSERPGTMALNIEPVVSPEEKKNRSARLIALSDAKWKRFYEAQSGKTAKVLFEHNQTDGRMHGFTENYVRVEAPYKASWVNVVVPVTLGKFNREGTALLLQP